MKKKYFTIVIGIMVLAASVGVTMMLAGMKKAPERKKTKAKPILVLTRSVENRNIKSKVSVIGNLTAENRIELYSEVNGVLQKSSRPFLEGIGFKKNESLVRIKSDEFYKSIKAQKSSFMNQIAQVLPDLKIDYPDAYKRFKTFLSNFELDKTMDPLPRAQTDQEKYFLSSQNIYKLYYDIAGMEEKLKKYNLKAPFNGVVTSSLIKPGTLVRAGQKLGEFIDTSHYYMETYIKLSETLLVHIGDSVELSSDDIAGTWTGKVSRISDSIDSKTRTLKIFVSVSGKNLKEGMYLKGNIVSDLAVKTVEIPRKLLVNQNSVMVIRQSKIDIMPITVVQYRDETVLVNGLDDGTELPLKISGLSKGMSVRVQKIKP